MAQITHGVRSVLSSAAIYNLTQRVLGAEHTRKVLVRDYIRPKQGDVIFDIGCGTAELLPHLPNEVQYVGFDLSQNYIDAAIARFGSRGKFECMDIANYNDSTLEGGADIVLAVGILHHLEDDEARTLMKTAWKKLRPGGRFISLDGALVPEQSSIARALLMRDRGQNIRSPEAYASLASAVFDRVETATRHDLLFVPYTHCILECVR